MRRFSTLVIFALAALLVDAPLAQAEPDADVDPPAVDQRIIDQLILDQLIIDQLLIDQDMSGGDHVVGEELCARPAYRHEQVV